MHPDWSVHIIRVQPTNIYMDWKLLRTATSTTDIDTMVSKIEEFKKLAYFDHLTWLWNKRLLEQMLWNEINELNIERVKRNNEFERRSWSDFWKTSVLMFDIDHFKSVNDTLWHAEWDRILMLLGETIRRVLRGRWDAAFRYWWEEFVIILQNAWINIAEVVFERLRKTIESNIKTNWERFLSDWTKISSVVTISGWFTELRSDDCILNWKITAIERADEFLYKSKTSWRNRITWG